MATEINKNRRCVVIAGAPCADAAYIKAALRPLDYIICADRGYQTAVEAGVTPNLLVGDFDSYQGGLPRGVEIIRLNPEKDNTDTLHCVKTALERGFTDFLLLAATGGRLDHTLANLSVTEYLADRGSRCIILSENQKMVKLIRAQGECLGIRSRRRTRQAAISSGERHIRIDPEISEWGNPARQYRVSVR